MHDSAKGGAWPLLVGEVICLLNCVNERDLCQLLDRPSDVGYGHGAWLAARRCMVILSCSRGAGRKGETRLLIGIMQSSNCIETRAQSRSVMLLKCSGLHAHYTDSDNELLLRLSGIGSLARRGWGTFGA